MPESHHYVYFAPNLDRAAVFASAVLNDTTERHHIELDTSRLAPVMDPSAELLRAGAEGAVFELTSGLPSERHLTFISQALRSGRRTWLYWPGERAVECVDDERLQSLRHHRTAVTWLTRLCGPIDRAVTRWQRVAPALRWIYRGEFPVRRSDIFIKLSLLSLRAQPVPFHRRMSQGIAPEREPGLFRVPGVGLYLRADYWRRSPSNTSQVAMELAQLSERLVCLTPDAEVALDNTEVQQIVMDVPGRTAGEDAIVLAPTHYWPIVKAICQALCPMYLYERLCAGQSVGAEVSQLLGIPYIVEYPGVDTSTGLIDEELDQALDGRPPFYSELYSKAEELALRQATVVLVRSARVKDDLVARGVDEARVLVQPGDCGLGRRLAAVVEAQTGSGARATSIETGDVYKDRVQQQWNANPVGSQHARSSQPHTLEWFLEVESHRYGVYAPWMSETMEFAQHAGHDVLEIGGGIGTDLAQYAAHGATVTDVDLSDGHLQLAEENFRLRGLHGRFVHHDAESLPFEDQSFDLVYSNGVLHHTPNTSDVVGEINRVLRPGGRAIVMVYAENSLHYWRKLVWTFGVKQGLLDELSMGEIMSRSVERSADESRPLVKVYTKRRVRRLFKAFAAIEVLQRQLLAEELPGVFKLTRPLAERCLGWNVIVKAVKRDVGREEAIG